MKNYQDILFPYAYNILGSVEDAKDTIQDVLMKYLSVDKRNIENEIGYLIKSVINQSINIKKRKNKISVNNVWLPEPISTENPDDNLNKNEILSYSLLTLLEKLTAKERAVFILKEAFDYAHQEIADTLTLTIGNSRKLLSRAKTKLNDYNLTSESVEQSATHILLNPYIEVMKRGDMDALEKLLSNDILLTADGGENIKVVKEFSTGIKETSQLLLYVFNAFLIGLEMKFGVINHQPAILFFKQSKLSNCQVFGFENDKIKRIFSIVDPQKLKSFYA